MRINLPLDCESRHSGLLSKDIALDALNDGLGRGLGVKFLRVVLVVDIVTNADELPTVVGTGQEDDSYTENIGVRNARSVRSLGLEDELVDADGDGADKQRVKLLVVLVAAKR